MQFRHDTTPPRSGLTPADATRSLWHDMLRVGVGMFGFMLIAQVVGVVVSVWLLRHYPAVLYSSWANLGLNTVCLYLVGGVCLYLPLRRVTKDDLPHREHGRMKPALLLKLFAMCYALVYAGNIITLSFVRLLSQSTGSDLSNPITNMIDSSTSMVALGLYTLVVAPFMEELLFRGVLLSRLRKHGDAFACVVSALLFALFHTNLYQFLFAFLIGLALGYVVLRFGKLRYAVALHAMNNSVSFLSNIVYSYGSEATQSIYSLFVLALVLLGGVLLFSNYARVQLQRCRPAVVAGQKFASVMLNPGLLFFYALVMLLVRGSNFL